MPQMKMFAWSWHLVLIQCITTVFFMNKFYLEKNSRLVSMQIPSPSQITWCW